MAKKPTPQEEGDILFTGIKVKSSKKKAAGMPAIVSSIQQAGRYMKPSQVGKLMFKVNQKGGFDCPGCAWPDPDDDRSALGEYCENGLKAIAEEATKRRITAAFFQEHSVSTLSKKSDFEIGKLGRLTEPMFLDVDMDRYVPISWEDAFKMVGTKLNGLSDPDQAIFYTSGRTSNEAAFLYQLFVRGYGTNNLPDCSNMCHESSGQALSQTVGIGKGSVTLSDIHEAEVIIVMGQNPGTNHPRMLTALEKCKQNGGKIIAINPLPEAGLINFVNPQKVSKVLTGGTKLSDLFLQVRINGDVSLLKAIMKLLLIEEDKNPGEVIDHTFIKKNTAGYADFISALDQERLEDCVASSGVDLETIRSAVEIIKSKQKIIICWAMGITQHENGVETIREIVNLLLMKGAIGKPGAGTCPVRGHSNVQGDRTMGIWEAPKEAFLDRLGSVFNFDPPREHGYSVIDAIQAMHENKGKVFFALGGNFLSASPDTHYTAEALRRCDLTVHVSTKLNRSHLIHGKQALILPCLGRTELDVQKSGEQFVSVENSMGVVHSSRGVIPPSSLDLMSEVSIVCHLAKATLDQKIDVDWNAMMDNYDHVRDAIEKVIPGFDDYNKRVLNADGFYLPNGARDGNFKTNTGKANFTVNEIPNRKVEENEFIMMTVRSHDQYNTTIYGLDDRYRGIYSERRVVMMNENDMKEYGFSKLQKVDLTSHYNGVRREVKQFLVVPYDIPEGCVATYFPEANPLVPIDSFAKGSKTPASKFVPITIQTRDA